MHNYYVVACSMIDSSVSICSRYLNNGSLVQFNYFMHLYKMSREVNKSIIE